MAAPDPHGDQRIEELLSQLQGIFSKLSTTDQAEAKEKENLPPSAPLIEHFSEPEAAPAVPPPAQVATGNPSEQSLHTEGVRTPIPVPPPTPEPVAAPMEATPAPAQVQVPEPVPPAPAQVPAALPPAVTVPEPVVVETAPASLGLSEAPDDESTIRVAICYPEGNENEVKILSQKLETLSPKFTKVSFRLAVRMTTPYKPKTTDWTEDFFTHAQNQKIRAYFFIVPRPMEEAKRKVLAASLEQFGIYYQEVPLISIEKRAFYMDLLLGLVFFFDSHGLTPKLPTEPAP